MFLADRQAGQLGFLFGMCIERRAADDDAVVIKEKKMKVQAAIQGEQVRVTGKKRDDLQEVIALLRAEKESLDMPLQFNNFRD